MSSPGLQGLRPWMIQRISAAFIALYVIYLFSVLLLASPLHADKWAQWVAQPWNTTGMALFMLAILWHAWIGVRDIILDYVPNVVARLLVLTVLAGIIIGSGLWGLKALLMVAIK